MYKRSYKTVFIALKYKTLYKIQTSTYIILFCFPGIQCKFYKIIILSFVNLNSDCLLSFRMNKND